MYDLTKVCFYDILDKRKGRGKVNGEIHLVIGNLKLLALSRPCGRVFKDWVRDKNVLIYVESGCLSFVTDCGDFLFLSFDWFISF